jgi:hypothetical protein
MWLVCFGQELTDARKQVEDAKRLLAEREEALAALRVELAGAQGVRVAVCLAHNLTVAVAG